MLHLIDLALSEKPQLQEAVDFSLTVVPYSAKEKTDLFVVAKIPTNRIQEKAGEKTEIVTIIFNAQNDIAVMQRKEVSLGQYGVNEVFNVSSISLPPGPYECRVVTRNMTTGKGARGACQVTFPKPRNRASFSCLRFCSSRENSLFLSKKEHRQKKRRVSWIFFSSILIYIIRLSENWGKPLRSF